MANKHIAELLIEANKKMSDMINSLQSSDNADKSALVEGLNNVIRSLDHIVEEIEKG